MTVLAPGSIGYAGPKSKDEFWARYSMIDPIHGGDWPVCDHSECEMPAILCLPGRKIEGPLCYGHAMSCPARPKLAWITMPERA